MRTWAPRASELSGEVRQGAALPIPPPAPIFKQSLPHLPAPSACQVGSTRRSQGQEVNRVPPDLLPQQQLGPGGQGTGGAGHTSPP